LVITMGSWGFRLRSSISIIQSSSRLLVLADFSGRRCLELRRRARLSLAACASISRTETAPTNVCTTGLRSGKESNTMDIVLHEISIREVAEGYVDNEEEGVIGYGGRLNIR